MQEMQEIWVWPWGQEDSLEKEMATHSSILAWKCPWTEEPVHESQRVGHDWTYTHTHTHTHTLSLSLFLLLVLWGFLGFTGIKNLPVTAGDTRDTGLISGSGRSLWNRKCQPTPVFLPGESHGQRSLVGYSPWVTKSQTLLSIHACILVLNYSINMKV